MVCECVCVRLKGGDLLRNGVCAWSIHLLRNGNTLKVVHFLRVTQFILSEVFSSAQQHTTSKAGEAPGNRLSSGRGHRRLICCPREVGSRLLSLAGCLGASAASWRNCHSPCTWEDLYYFVTQVWKFFARARLCLWAVSRAPETRYQNI